MATANTSSATSSTFPRVWFITGASRGIGARIAEAALAQGDAVVATARDATSIDQRFGKLDALLPVALDVTNEAQAAVTVQAALARFGRIALVAVVFALIASAVITVQFLIDGLPLDEMLNAPLPEATPAAAAALAARGEALRAEAAGL